MSGAIVGVASDVKMFLISNGVKSINLFKNFNSSTFYINVLRTCHDVIDKKIERKKDIVERQKGIDKDSLPQYCSILPEPDVFTLWTSVPFKQY